MATLEDTVSFIECTPIQYGWMNECVTFALKTLNRLADTSYGKEQTAENAKFCSTGTNRIDVTGV